MQETVILTEREGLPAAAVPATVRRVSAESFIFVWLLEVVVILNREEERCCEKKEV